MTPAHLAARNGLAIALLSVPLAAQMAPGQRWIVGEVPGRGLPSPQAVWAPYDADPEHPANRLFRSLFVVQTIPADVAAVLPGERQPGQPVFVPDWYFQSRAGRAEDARWFGGDSLQLPREGFTPGEKERFVAELANLTSDHADDLKRTPRLAIWLQNDLLRMAGRLMEIESDLDLLPAIRMAAERLALPRSVLVDRGLATFDLAQLPVVEPALSVSRLVELDRKSSKLFDAERSLLWSRVLVQWPVGTKIGLDEHLQAARSSSAGSRPSVPLHTRAVLVQGIVALADDGSPVATPVVIDVRLQHYAGAEPLSPENPTTTRDGTQFRVFWLERQTMRERGDALRLAHFRELHADDEALFRDYGRRKHTTVAGQCALCHRISGTPERELAGFPVLRPGSDPKRVDDPETRLRLAEKEFARFLLALRNRPPVYGTPLQNRFAPDPPTK